MIGYQTGRLKLTIYNSYTRQFKLTKSYSILPHTSFEPRAFYASSIGYTGSVSIRYVFRKKESVKMPGF
jgi:hypothetical protein